MNDSKQQKTVEVHNFRIIIPINRTIIMNPLMCGILRSISQQNWKNIKKN